MKNRSSQSPHSYKKPKQEKMVDMSKQDSFLFNKTPILASALQKLKKNQGSDKKKQIQTFVKKSEHKIQPQELQMDAQPTKKVKRSNDEPSLPSFAYTPLQKDLYNFYTINKVLFKTMQSVPEPKFEVGSLILTAICDRGIGGKYLVTNLFRNKKGYIDYKQVSQGHTGKDDFTGIQSYHQPGDFVICSVVKSINQNHLQLSLSKFIDLDTKHFRVGQVLPAQIKSKQQLGCHLIVSKCKQYKFFLPKSDMDQQIFQSLTQNKQIIVTITNIDNTKHLIKTQLSSQQHTGLNLRGIEQQQMSKIQLQQYVSPGTLLNTKVIKVLKNGVMVKYFKIFIGFIHIDHLQNNLQYYTNDSKISARIIYSCINPPFIYLSQRHVNLHKYQPKRALYSAVNKPQNLSLLQGSYINKQQQFFVHPTQLHSQIQNVTKFWVKQNNYFQRYQIMGSRKLGLRVGEVAKQIPFNNFKIFGQGQGNKFKVLCLDVWNKVIKLSYDDKFIKSSNMLYDIQDIDINVDKQYCGIVKGINDNGIIVQFCNNIRGTLPKNQLKMQEVEINQSNIGKSIQVYISHIKAKKNFITLSLIPPAMRNRAGSNKANTNDKSKNKIQQQQVDKEQKGQQSYHGTIASVDAKSIHPIYIKLKSKLVKISIFNGIRPASIHNLPVIKQLTEHYQVGQKVRVFRKGKQYYLYPPEQLSDKLLRICKVVSQKGSLLRLQVGKSQFKNCHICDITDLITPYPFGEVTIGQYKIGRLLSNGMICLRQSIVMNGIPKNMLECKEKYASDQLRGDYRNRVLTVGSAGLKEDTVLFGYVKLFSEKGCFVSISNDFQVRIQMCQLTDQYIVDKAKYYPINKLMLVRLISEKVKPSDPTKHLFDASARESIVKMGYPINQEALMVGLTVSGKVTSYTKGKALIKLDGSKFTGIMNPTDVEGIDKDEPIEKSMKLGTHYTMKIIELSNQGRRLIRLSTLNKYFNKFKGVQLDLQADKNAINLWQNYQEMLQEQPPANNMEVEHHDQEQDEEDQYERIKKLVNNQFGQDDDEQMQDQGQLENFKPQKPHKAQKKVQNKAKNKKQERKEEHQDQEQQQDEEQDEQNEDQEEENQMVDEQSQSKSKSQKSHGLQNTLSKEQVSRRLAQFRKMNQPTQIYQSIVLANDSSESHLQYISSLISNPSITPDQIREQFVKSIAMLQTIKDKENMWIAWLNMELILGDFMGLVKKAISSDAGLNVYNRIIQILREQDNWQVAFEMAKKMLKKFNNDPKAYCSMLKFMVQEQVHTGKHSITLKELLRRASQCLKAKDLITIESHYGKILYEQKEKDKSEQARTVFSNILTKNPKRTDLWSMYVDLQLKHGSVDKAREIMQRCLTIKLKRKKIISMLKKYHQLEQKYGTPQSAAKILERAKTIAMQYEEEKDENSENDDE